LPYDAQQFSHSDFSFGLVMGLASKIMIPQNFNVRSCHLAYYAECIYRGVVGIKETGGRHMFPPWHVGIGSYQVPGHLIMIDIDPWVVNGGPKDMRGTYVFQMSRRYGLTADCYVLAVQGSSFISYVVNPTSRTIMVTDSYP
jgi:hypothetical protein